MLSRDEQISLHEGLNRVRREKREKSMKDREAILLLGEIVSELADKVGQKELSDEVQQLVYRLDEEREEDNAKWAIPEVVGNSRDALHILNSTMRLHAAVSHLSSKDANDVAKAVAVFEKIVKATWSKPRI